MPSPPPLIPDDDEPDDPDWLLVGVVGISVAILWWFHAGR